jgi:uncharacterized protein YbjT (DUF2867 family)
MMSPTALDEAFGGVDGVYSVQTGWDDGFEAEVIQGINVADAARRAGVAHIVYGSAGPGEPGTGVGSWDSKERVAAHMRSLALPLTVLRPTAFMELMTDRDFYPMVSTWQVMPKVMGGDRPVPWLAVDDLGAVTARVFADPDAFVGGDIPLAGDRRSITECAEIWRRVHGRAPRRIPMRCGGGCRHRRSTPTPLTPGESCRPHTPWTNGCRSEQARLGTRIREGGSERCRAAPDTRTAGPLAAV